MHTDGTVSIIVNGEHKRVSAGLTILQLAEELGPPDEGMVAEAMGELTALTHRVRTGQLPEQHRADAS